MAKNNVYLKRLDVVEALGAVNIIATDKTGTLTKNTMTVTDVWYMDNKITGLWRMSLVQSRPGFPDKSSDSKEVNSFPLVLERLLTTLSVCNAARFLKQKLEDPPRL